MSCPEELNVFFGPDDDTPTPGVPAFADEDFPTWSVQP
jgi:hypothetical protein